MDRNKLKEILDLHAKWIENQDGGSRANLTGANLTGTDLTGANLTRANLTGANLNRTDLTGADLTGADLYGADLTRANLTGANLTGANLYGANLYRANLTGTDLNRTNLTGADLTGADLTGADLYGADLTGADLYGARGVNPNRSTPLRMLFDQPGPIRAYKIVNAENEGPMNGGITYEINGKYEVFNADTDELKPCGAGINLATLDWCIAQWREGYRILIAEFTAKDIAAIPDATDGKFRVHRCQIVGEKNLVEMGLIKEGE